MTALTILNSIVLIYLLLKVNTKLYIEFKKEKTFRNNTLLGYSFTLWRKLNFGATGVYKIHIPVRNRRKTELREEVNRMIAKYDNQSKRQALSAMFSWLKTWEEVRQFEKDYSVVDRKIVESLVHGFVPKE